MKTVRLRAGIACLPITGFLVNGCFERARGLLGRAQLGVDEAMVIISCKCVHTFGMRYPIDIVFLDRFFRVLAVMRDVNPCRLAFDLRAQTVVELPAGAASRYGIEPDQRIQLET